MTVFIPPKPDQIVRVPNPPAVQVVRVITAGPPGPAGSVAGTLPWAQVTDKPDTLTYDNELAAVRTELLNAQSYTQAFSSSAVIVVPHHLGRYPAVTVLDSAGTEWEGAVTYDSPNQLTVTLSFPFSGQVTCS